LPAGIIVPTFPQHSPPSLLTTAAFLVAAAALCGLTVLAFGISAIAWYRRTREKQQVDRRIRFLAHHDELTALANRSQLIEQLDREIAALRKP
jgi:predicted signal transduction protein with EAL and GGDEF domain